MYYHTSMRQAKESISAIANRRFEEWRGSSFEGLRGLAIGEEFDRELSSVRSTFVPVMLSGIDNATADDVIESLILMLTRKKSKYLDGLRLEVQKRAIANLTKLGIVIRNSSFINYYILEIEIEPTKMTNDIIIKHVGGHIGIGRDGKIYGV